jgi:glycosyltransferase involved in cell wall biosynthesis
LRIALIYPYWTHPDVAYEFPRALASRGHGVSAFVWCEGKTGIEKIDGFQVHYLPGTNLPLARFLKSPYPSFSNISKEIFKLKPEIVDLQSHLFLTTLQGLQASEDSKIPALVTVSGVIAERGLVTNLAQHAYLYTVASNIFRRVKLVRCLTEGDALDAMKYGCQRDKIRVVPNFIDTDLFSPKGGGDENLVAWVGRFVPEKGLPDLVRAAKAVVARNKDVKFLLVGDGPTKGRIQQMVHDLDLSRNFTFTGTIRHSDVARLLAGAAMFVMPSYREGMPFALLEAMSCAKPVVGSDISGIRDLVNDGKNGLLVKPGNPEALAKAISELLGDPLLRDRFGQSSRHLILDNYSKEVVMKQVEQIYHEVIDAASG